MTNDHDYVFLNGEIVGRDKAMVSAFDRGFLYGDGVFETMRSYEGVVFRLGDHLRRLSLSAEELRIDLPMPVEKIAGAARKLIELNRLNDAYVRISLTRGEHTGSIALVGARAATLLIDCRPLRPYPVEWYVNGIRLATSMSRRSRSALAPRHKSLSYIENILALNKAREEGAHEALILTEDGRICEGATSNIFWAAAGRICTAAPEANFLCGITRAVVVEICGRLGIEVDEGLFRPSELARADEVFITNSIMEIMPVAAVDARPIGNGPGKLTARLRQEYAAEVTRAVDKDRAE